MSYKLFMLDKRIMQHIAMNGSMTDPVGKDLTLQFIRAALGVHTIRNAALKYSFTADDLSVIYSEMVEGLRPNPTIRGGGPMLAATLPFVEPFRIEAFMENVSRQLSPQMTQEVRRKVMIDQARTMARTTWETHTAARGEAPFSINALGSGRGTSSGGGRGCLIFSIALALLALLIYGVVRLLL